MAILPDSLSRKSIEYASPLSSTSLVSNHDTKDILLKIKDVEKSWEPLTFSL